MIFSGNNTMKRWLTAARFIDSDAAAGADPYQLDADRPAVTFEGVSKVYAGSAEGAAPTLSGISLSVPAGEIFGIIGRSGAGKSTLLRLINGLEKPSIGIVRVHGTDVGSLDSNNLVRLRRHIGMVFQHFNLLSAKTVYENIALPLRIAGVPKAVIEARMTELLDLVGLRERRNAWPAQLSGGQKQRVGIARALVHMPDILLCDEATSALDPETTRSILTLLRDINRRLGVTIVLITHEMEVIRDVCDTVAVIEQGKVVEVGPVWRVFGDPQHTATCALLHHGERAISKRADEHSEQIDSEAAVYTRVLLEIRYTGGLGIEPDLCALTRVLGIYPGAVSFLQGGIERIQGRPLGRLVIAAPLGTNADHVQARRLSCSLAEAARAHADHVEVLGYA